MTMIEPSFGEEIDCGGFFDDIDDLLDFPTDDVDTCFATNTNSNTVLPAMWPNHLDPFPSPTDLPAELSVPYEDTVKLEWLSSFEEESFSNGCLSMKKQNTPSNDKCTDFIYYPFQTSSPVSVLESSSSSEAITPAFRGIRRKRARPSTFSPRHRIQTSVEQFDSETSVEFPGLVEKSEKKKRTVNPNSTSAGVRKCLHCEITKTPQWRAGPMGPKTLCNACGVRHKSGRLFPEYRPAASPTFVPSLHSNSHKKVAEMRKKAVDDSASIAESPKAY